MTDLPPYAVDFRGHPACPCQVAWLPAFEHEAQRRGILAGSLPLSQIIGGAPQSGGTHTSGGADDTYPLTGLDVDAYVWLSRQMGADATWLRPYNWDGAGGVAHVHRVLRGCPHNGPARSQIDAVDDGYNGLGSGGRGASDTGPRPLSNRTWQQGIEWARAQEDDMTPQQEKTLSDVAAGVARLNERVNEIAGNVAKRDAALRAEMRKRFKATDAEVDDILAAVDKR